MRDEVRHGVRSLLAAQQGFSALDPETRRDLAGSLVKIGSAALANDELARRPVPRRPMGTALNAGSEFSGVATDRVAGTTQAVLNAVSFPRFVTELITGVFKAMNDSNQQQMTAFVDLIRNVAQTTEGFADANVGIAGARAWIAERFPTAYAIEGAEDEEPEDLSGLDPEERRQRQAEIQAERDAATRLVLRPGASPPSEAALRAAFELPEEESISGGNPEALVPLARQVMARGRQQLLATMIQMGLQRIVIESGRLNASMRFHIDASSAAAQDRGSQFDMRNTTEVGVNGKVGIWGAEAKMQNTIGYVSTDRVQTNEEMNTSVDLDSAVELIFRTDYVALDRLAGGPAQERIRVNSLNPEAEAARASQERTAAAAARRADRIARSGDLNTALRTPPAPPAMAPLPARSGGAGSGTGTGTGTTDTSSPGAGGTTGAGAGTGTAGSGTGAGSTGSGAGAGTGNTGTGTGGASTGTGAAGSGAGGAPTGTGAGAATGGAPVRP
ncbi:hypothetical protein [Allosphingosinicella deserti]|uniref:hypothetical protein n=1 Tax=Allosphingosinicella deserti TaxID=2116704 RepID=UPI0011B24BC6|nr:hypothetical protein [Sphingomonas deserti]